ncbi:hypothetical protein G9A89_001070 [Geosiphon pyriformis]|nr:hypothetical protein G9A89_001070 [Geosiphon pyriformis]
MSPWEIMESEEEKKEKAEDQEFTYQKPIPKNSDIEIPNFQTQQDPNLENLEIETPNFQTSQNLNNTNHETINQENVPSLLQHLQQQLQQPNLDSMAYTLIAKLEKFTGEEDNPLQPMNRMTQEYSKPFHISYRILPTCDIKEFKIAFLEYFSNNNSINCLANTFTTIKQGETEAVITYLGYFHRNLHQIQAIQADYSTVPQILNQFIKGLCSSILQCVCSMHPADFQATVTNTRDFELAKLEANYAQAINLVMNRSSKLNSKLKQFSNSINQKLERYLANNHETQIMPKINCIQYRQPINHGNRKCMYATTLSTQPSTISTNLPTNDTTANISTIHILIFSLSTTTTSNIATNNLLDTHSSNTTIKPSLNDIRKSQIKSYPELEIDNDCSPTNSQFIQPAVRITTAEFKNQNYLSLLVTPEDTPSNNLETNQKLLTSNIPPATIMEDRSLAAIFPFEIEELTETPLFSGVTLKEKLITVIKETPIDAAWRQAAKCLDGCSHDNNKTWRMAFAKIERVSLEKIRMIKNNPPEPIELD